MILGTMKIEPLKIINLTNLKNHIGVGRKCLKRVFYATFFSLLIPYCNITDEVWGLVNNFFFIQRANVKADTWFCMGLT